jgi:hypothetical protein
VLAKDRLLPATPLLRGLLPLGGLQRGTTTIVTASRHDAGEVAGVTTLALELLAGASSGGYWCAAVGLSDLGLLAAAEHGVALDRLLLVPSPGSPGRWQQVLAALFDGVDAVLFAPTGPVRQSDSRRLSKRARDRGSALIVLDRQGFFGELGDLRCTVASSRCSGLYEGHGLIRGRSLEIVVSGRGSASRPLKAAVNS